MRRRLKNLKNKSGDSANGAPRQLIDEAVYREHFAKIAHGQPYDAAYSGWSHASRPRDMAISLRRSRVGGGFTIPPPPPP